MPITSTLALSLGLLLGTALAPAAAGAATAESSPPTKAAEFPSDWFWDIKGSSARFASLLGKAPPKLTVKDWIGPARDLGELRGNVVVVDFWATWCPACVSSLPELNELATARAKDGLVVIGVHDAKKGADRMAQLAKDKGLSYSLAVDDSGASASAWKVSFWPTIAVIDRAGTLRAIGLRPDRVKNVVDTLLAEPRPEPPAEVDSGKPAAAISMGALGDPPAAAKPVADDLNVRFGEGDAKRRNSLANLAAKGEPPAIASPEWINSEPFQLADHKGKVVVLDFWATWCGPCLKSIPHMNDLAEKYKDRVVIVGVCHPRGGEKMATTAKDHGIRYPICRLTSEEVLKAYVVDSYPDYYLIDREGKLRIVDCANAKLDEAIEALLR